MRQIVLDTETTGLSRVDDRVIEIGCVEIVNLVPTGRTYHQYINPTHPVSPGAFRVHGLSNEFLKAYPTFRRIYRKFLDFISDAPIIAHNAKFDVSMLNAELERLGVEALSNDVIDTLPIARVALPRKKHTLDAMCSHFGIDNSKRTKHGALLDSELLAEVYVELLGGRQIGFGLKDDETKIAAPAHQARQRPSPLPSRLTAEDIEAHRAFVGGFKSNFWQIEKPAQPQPQD